MANINTLLLSPHIDDEILGCYSFLNSDTHILYFGVEDRPDVSREQRIEELKSCQQIKKFSWQIENFTVNSYLSEKLIGIIEECIQLYKPSTVLLPIPSYNQDHRAVYHAARVALRPHDRNFFVSRVLVFEQPHTFLWPEDSFEPNYFIGVDIDEKIRLYELYKSQVRGHRSSDILKAQARLRGAQCCTPYAEAFDCIRYVNHKNG